MATARILDFSQVIPLRDKGLSNRAIARQLGVSEVTVRRTLKRIAAAESDDDTPTVRQNEDGTYTVESVQVDCIRSEAELLAVAGLSLDRWMIIDQAHRAWTQLGPEGRVYQMHHVTVRVAPRLSAICRPAKVQKFEAPPIRRAVKTGTAAFIPDSQNGYVWSAKYEHLEPLHDRRAWDVCVQVCADAQPEWIYLLGDMMDLAPLSTKYSRPPSFNMTLQPTLDELHWWLARLRAACPDSRIVYQAGNHEMRKDKLLHERAPELTGVRQANSRAEVLSLRHLLRLDELRIEAVEQYGDGTWLWRGESEVPVWVHHGSVVRGGGGATSKAANARGKYHEVFGHIHRNEMVSGTTHGPSGLYHLHTLTPGCICRVDGAVPGVSVHPDWQQGIGFMHLIDRRVHPELVHIQHGVAVRGDTVYTGHDRATEIADATGWRQMAPIGDR